MAKKSPREQVYIDQLKALGIYDPAFDPEIRDLADLEREKTRVKKAWSATVPKGSKPSFADLHYAILCSIRREILTHREALGLTPKSLRRLRGAAESGGSVASASDILAERLSALADRTAAYEGGREAVSYQDTGADG